MQPVRETFLSIFDAIVPYATSLSRMQRTVCRIAADFFRKTDPKKQDDVEKEWDFIENDEKTDEYEMPKTRVIE